MNSSKILILSVAAAFLVVIGSALMFYDSQSGNSEKNLIDNIEFQNRHGNVATTKLYIVKLSNGSEFRYSKTIPGPGMLCDTNNSKGNCETETEPGYIEINSAISSSEYRKQEESFSTYYYPKNKKCVENISNTKIELSDCN